MGNKLLLNVSLMQSLSGAFKQAHGAIESELQTMNSVVNSLFPEFSGNMADCAREEHANVQKAFTTALVPINRYAQTVKEFSEAVQAEDGGGNAAMKLMAFNSVEEDQADQSEPTPPELTAEQRQALIDRFDHNDSTCLDREDWQMEMEQIRDHYTPEYCYDQPGPGGDIFPDYDGNGTCGDEVDSRIDLGQQQQVSTYAQAYTGICADPPASQSGGNSGDTSGSTSTPQYASNNTQADSYGSTNGYYDSWMSTDSTPTTTATTSEPSSSPSTTSTASEPSSSPSTTATSSYDYYYGYT